MGAALGAAVGVARGVAVGSDRSHTTDGRCAASRFANTRDGGRGDTCTEDPDTRAGHGAGEVQNRSYTRGVAAVAAASSRAYPRSVICRTGCNVKTPLFTE